MNNWIQSVRARFALRELRQRSEVIRARTDLIDLCDKYGYKYILGVYFREDQGTTLFHSVD